MAEGFTCETIGDITYHVFSSSSEAAIDAWAAALARLIDDTPPDRPFRVLMDVSSNRVSFSGYARQTSKTLFTRYKTRRGRLAFLFSSKTAPHYARIFFASLGRIQFQTGYFSSRERALGWLREI